MTIRWAWAGPWQWRFYRHLPWSANECHRFVLLAGPITFWTNAHVEQDGCDRKYRVRRFFHWLDEIVQYFGELEAKRAAAAYRRRHRD